MENLQVFINLGNQLRFPQWITYSSSFRKLLKCSTGGWAIPLVDFIGYFNTIWIKLVGGLPTPLKNMSSSVGMIIPSIWKNKIHVPNHQPDKFTHLN